MWVLAVDIERSGPNFHDETIAIGACVLDEDANILETLFCPGYFPGKIVFDTRCWNQFWQKRQNVLHQLTYNGPFSYRQRQQEMIFALQNFRYKWEVAAKNAQETLELVSDNVHFDIGFLNALINRYDAGVPIPYSQINGRYGCVWDVHSLLRGFLLGAEGKQKHKHLFRTLQELYDVPRFSCSHDHLPHHDAAYVAFQFVVLHQIQTGKIIRKPQIEQILATACEST